MFAEHRSVMVHAAPDFPRDKAGNRRRRPQYPILDGKSVYQVNQALHDRLPPLGGYVPLVEK